MQKFRNLRPFCRNYEEKSFMEKAPGLQFDWIELFQTRKYVVLCSY